MTYFLMGKDVNSKKNNEWGVWNCDFNTKNSEWNVKDVDCDTANDKYMKKTGDSAVLWDGYGCTQYADQGIFEDTSAPSSAPFSLEIADNKKESLGNSLV